MGNKGKIIILGIVGIITLVVIFGIFNIIPVFKHGSNNDPNYPTSKIELNFWGLDNSRAFSGAIKAYTKIHKNIKINYTKYNLLKDYKEFIINSLAEGNGPDLFMIPDYWVETYKGIMVPAYPNLVNIESFKYFYPDVVSQDFIRDGKIYAMPLYMDSLVLLYNKDIFNAKAVVFPPKTWDEFASDVVKTRETSNSGGILQAGAAIGTANNINNFADIISAIMLQLGTINDKNSAQVRFSKGNEDAVKFYTQFANPISAYYTWNSEQEEARSAFAYGEATMIIEYNDAIKKIKDKNPFIKIGVSEIPQINVYKPRTFAKYMGIAVAKKSIGARAYVAWDFLKFLTTRSDINKLYLDATGRLPAIKSSIQKLIGGEDDVFARSFLFASSWRRYNWDKIQNIFRDMINNILSGKSSVVNAVKAAQGDINDLFKMGTK